MQRLSRISPGWIAWLACLAALLAAHPAASDDVPRAYVSIEPLRYLVDRVAGARMSVETLVRPGQEPETYEPTVRQMAGLTGAAVFFGVGLPLESAWRRRLAKASGRGPEWVDLSRGLSEPRDAQSTPGAGDGARDPHVWLSPANAEHMVTAIADTLAALDPAQASRYEASAARLRADLQSLDHEVADMIKKSGVRSFLVFHPAWGYFARDYGLRQIAIESEGKEPGPRDLTEIIRLAREEGIRTVFVDRSHSSRLASTVAAAIGGRTRALDPLAYDYLDNLRSAARAIAASGS